MKTTSLALLVLIGLLSTTSLCAQQKEAQANKQPYLKSTSSSASGTQIASGTGLQLIDGKLEGDEGSLYIGNDWPEGNLVLRGGKMMVDYRFRYDIYADQMQFITGNDTLAFASPSELYSVSFDEKTFVYEPYECSGMLMKGYFELIVPGKKQLLLKRSVSYHLEDEGNVSTAAKDTYLISECYFLKTGNLPAQKVMCNRKSALVAMGDKKNELDEYLRKTGNKVKSLDDLKRMVEYYNALE